MDFYLEQQLEEQLAANVDHSILLKAIDEQPDSSRTGIYLQFIFNFEGQYDKINEILSKLKGAIHHEYNEKVFKRIYEAANTIIFKVDSQYEHEFATKKLLELWRMGFGNDIQSIMVYYDNHIKYLNEEIFEEFCNKIQG